jgi:D-beta-D-heptose 7-phosphate kinase/D-beta-D-heptose 1-phosphate adenosyltransferase
MEYIMKIAVIGDYILDTYIYGEVERMSPESPIPIFLEKYTEQKEGGAANVNANLKALGNKTYFWYEANSVKKRYICDNHIMFRADFEEYTPYTGQINFDLSGIEYCILSDYNKGYLHRSQEIVDYCISKGCKVIVDPKKPLDKYKNSSIIKLNQKELIDYTPPNMTFKEIRTLYNIGSLVITMGKNGVYISSNEFEGPIFAEQHQVSDVTGAGDVFIASMTHFLNKGENLFNACSNACKLASISVTKFGTYVLTEEDIKQTRTIFTNGCFDILHKGHVDYLRKSKSLGAKLIVGINSDASVKRLKGINRPINNQDDRKTVLESLDCVDEVIIFDEDTPYDLIKNLNPSMITKGGDYKTEEVVGNDLAEVVIIPFVEGYSTTKVLEKMNG